MSGRQICSEEDGAAAFASVPRTVEAGQDPLRRFRTDVYDCLTARPDALFELLDGLCSPVAVGGSRM
jgi:hypothetical protein